MLPVVVKPLSIPLLTLLFVTISQRYFAYGQREVLLLPAVIGRLVDLDRPADVGDRFDLGDQLLSRLELVDDLVGCLGDLLHGEVPGPVWPEAASLCEV